MTKDVIYVTKIKRGNKPESNLITDLYCIDGNKGNWQNRDYVVILTLAKGYDKEFKTLSENGESAVIKVEHIEGKSYLTTKPNNIREDNLGNLPEV